MDETSVNRKFWIVIVITIVLLLGIGVVFYFFYVERSKNQDELQQVVQANTKLQLQVNDLKKKKLEMELNQDVARTYEAFLPSQENIPNMLTEIANRATSKNLMLKSTSITFPGATAANRKSGNTEFYRTGVFKLELIGKFPDVTDFINEVERSDRFLMVNDITLSPTSSNPKMGKDNWVDPLASPYLDFSILIYTFIYTGG